MSTTVTVTVKVTVLATWSATDKLRLYRGSENALSLAASTPAGGVKVTEREVGNAAVGSKITMSFQYRATDICATLPVGVTCVDAAGNESTVLQGIKDLNAPPQAPGRPSVTGTENPGEALLSWSASPDVSSTE